MAKCHWYTQIHLNSVLGEIVHGLQYFLGEPFFINPIFVLHGENSVMNEMRGEFPIEYVLTRPSHPFLTDVVSVNDIETMESSGHERQDLSSGSIQKMHLFFGKTSPTEMVMMLQIGHNAFAKYSPEKLQLGIFYADDLQSSQDLSIPELLQYIEKSNLKTQYPDSYYDRNQAFDRLNLDRDKCTVRIIKYIDAARREDLVLIFKIQE
jgi:hypothetical protein